MKKIRNLLTNSKYAGLALGLVALLAITTAAGVNGTFNSVTSALGYEVAGAAGEAAGATPGAAGGAGAGAGACAGAALSFAASPNCGPRPSRWR